MMRSEAGEADFDAWIRQQRKRYTGMRNTARAERALPCDGTRVHLYQCPHCGRSIEPEGRQWAAEGALELIAILEGRRHAEASLGDAIIARRGAQAAGDR